MSARIERYYSSNRNLIGSIEIEVNMWLALVECPFEPFDVLITQVDFALNGYILQDDVLHEFRRNGEDWKIFMKNCKRKFLLFSLEYVR